MPEEYELPHIVIDVVCKNFGVPKEQVLGRSHTKTRVLARQVICYILRDVFKYSYPEIGLVVNRDHTSARSAIARVSSRMGEDKFRRVVSSTIDEIRKVWAAAKEGQVVCVELPPKTHQYLQKLLETGLYGRDLGDVVERLVCQQLQGLKVSK